MISISELSHLQSRGFEIPQLVTSGFLQDPFGIIAAAQSDHSIMAFSQIFRFSNIC